MQDASKTEANVKAAYDRTTESIKKQTAETRKLLETERSEGRISEDQYALRSAQLDEINSKTAYQSELMKGLYKEIENSFGQRTSQFFDSMVTSLTELAQGHIKLKDAIGQIGLAFANMVASILKDIAMWIIKTLIQIELQTILVALSGGTSTGVGAATSGIGAAVGGKHQGGMIGGVSDGWSKTVSDCRVHQRAALPLGNHRRFCSPTNSPRSCRRARRSWRKNDPRNAMNGGGGKGGNDYQPANIKQVLVFDSSQVSSAMAGTHGEKVVVSHIKNNAAELRNILRG